MLDPKICTYPVYTSDPAEGTTPIGTWGSLRSPTQGKLILKNCILLGVRFYIPNLPNLVSLFPPKLGVFRTP